MPAAETFCNALAICDMRGGTGRHETGVMSVVALDLLASPPIAGAVEPPVSLEVVAGLLKGLNREQRRAVTHGEGPQVVIAGPGTGKTEVVTRRVAWLIATGRARPRDILALTFTDNAADEMQARVDLLLPYGQSDTNIHTFHAFGDQLLREHAFELGLPGDVRLINDAEAVVLLRDNLFELGLDRFMPLGDPTRFLHALAGMFGRAKDEGVDARTLAAHVQHLVATAQADPVVADVAASRAELARAYEAYSSIMARRGLIDHGDQLSLPLRLLRDRPGVRQEITARYRYLLVDEFQDMNRAQLELVSLLAGPAANVTVVGDPDQAIYMFRGAAGDSLSRFMTAHEKTQRIVLRTNYRSRKPIVDAGRRLMAHAQAGADRGAASLAVTGRPSRSATPVRVLSYETPELEADGIAAEIARRVGLGERPADFAVLTRSNAELGAMATNLTFRGLPVRSHTKSDFYARTEVRPLLALLRVCADPSLTLELYVLANAWPYVLGGGDLATLLAGARRRHRSLWEVLLEAVERPSAEFGATFVGRLGRLVADVRAAMDMAHQRSATEVLYDHLRRTGSLARLASQDDATDATSVARFFDIVRSRSALLADPRTHMLVPHLNALIEAEDDLADTGPLDLDAVSVLTAHRAKGLEFKVVFVTGLTDGRFPARGRPPVLDMPWADIRGDASEVESDRIDEERRLLFVALTRARDELWLSHHSSGPAGRGTRRPSPFLAETLDRQLAIPITPPTSVLERIVAPAAPTPPPTAASRNHAPKPTFSFSQLEDYLDCPERYRLRYVVGLPSPPHHSLSYGRALHEAVAFFHLESARGIEVSEGALLAAFDRAWTPEGFLSREHENARYEQGRASLKSFRNEQLANPAHVVSVEKPFELDIDGVHVRGRMDRVDEGDTGAVIVDYKSSDVRDQRKADQKARDSLQLQVYALAHERASGTLPAKMQLHFLDSGLVGTTRPDGERLERTRERVHEASDGIAAGAFPARPNPVSCGYCPFRQVCSSSAA